MSGLAAVARRLLLVPIVGAAYGWQDRVRGLPGPRIALALPLREPGGHASVPLLGLVLVWFAAFSIASVVVPVRRAPRPVAALVRGSATFAAVLLVQAVSLELVREATLGFAWHAALVSATPSIAAVCAAAATLLVAPGRSGAVAPARWPIDAVAEGHPIG